MIRVRGRHGKYGLAPSELRQDCLSGKGYSAGHGPPLPPPSLTGFRLEVCVIFPPFSKRIQKGTLGISVRDEKRRDEMDERKRESGM
ncbi:hypothetical protein E2C01_026450 [Portunus trituberculatus]|uniref:Uncharacterized protein n=1 Tax=Portunus trituberculatus TaxID=210409 RepID=A0A5B7EIB7_PORTR|nr:hypothetical protein [Portunus trituberculatus]